jgi:uncharacterized protein YbaR (Trm112 family)
MLALPERLQGALMLDQELLDILACPQCKGKVDYNASKTGLVCKACKLAYPIRDDIPVMLIDEATPLKD